MMFEWKPDMIRFMRDACEYGSMDALVAPIAPYLNQSTHILDAGCGLGYLSLALAERSGRVTAVDINENALAVLRKNCTEGNIRNIDILCADVRTLSPNAKYDAMVFCYFGAPETILDCAKRLCTGSVFIIKHNYELHRFSAGSYRKNHGFAETCRWLDAQGLSYTAIELEQEFGQPFRSLDEARRFFMLYSLDDDTSVITDRFLHDRLTETGREDFPLYLPNRKRSGCIILSAQELAEK